MTFVARPVIDRLFDKAEPDGDCWLYRGHLSRGGYSQITVGGWPRYRHIVAYETFVGPVPEGLELDHECRRPACFNPWHLEPVTTRINVLRSNAWGGINSRKTHCPKDHPYDAVNSQGRRICRRCAAAASLAHYHRTAGATA